VLLCIDKALAQAGVNRHDVNYVNAHATSTKAGDLQEYKALMRSFGENPEVRYREPKAMIKYYVLLAKLGMTSESRVFHSCPS
jgi:3-oxoacyl-[acyl-carrier-protein] synthase II